MLPAFYVQSLGQMQIGLLGMRRRIADYDPALGYRVHPAARHHRRLCHRHFCADRSDQLLSQRPQGRSGGGKPLALALAGVAAPFAGPRAQL